MRAVHNGRVTDTTRPDHAWNLMGTSCRQVRSDKFVLVDGDAARDALPLSERVGIQSVSGKGNVHGILLNRPFELVIP